MKTRTLLAAAAAFLLPAAPAAAQSSGEVVLTGLAAKTTDGGLTTYRFPDGGVAYFAEDLGRNLGSAEFRDASGATFRDPARGARAATWDVKEQGGIFFIDPAFRPAREVATAKIVTPYNAAYAPGGRLVYGLRKAGTGRYEADSEGQDQSW